MAKVFVVILLFGRGQAQAEGKYLYIVPSLFPVGAMCLFGQDAERVFAPNFYAVANRLAGSASVHAVLKVLCSTALVYQAGPYSEHEARVVLRARSRV